MHIALAISFLERLYNKQVTKFDDGHTCSGLQLATQLDSREDNVRIIVTEVSAILHSHSYLRDGEQTAS